MIEALKSKLGRLNSYGLFFLEKPTRYPPKSEIAAAYEYLAAQAHCEEEAERFEDDIRDHLRRMHRNDTPDNRAIVFRRMGIYLSLIHI